MGGGDPQFLSKSGCGEGTACVVFCTTHPLFRRPALSAMSLRACVRVCVVII